MARLWANLILKLNRSQLQKRKIRRLKDMLKAGFEDNGLVFPEVSNEELQKIKNRIREQAKKESEKRILLNLGYFALTIFLLWLCYYWIFK